MAVNWSVEHKRTSTYRFKTEDIKLKPELNGRTDLPEIKPLISDILTNGQLVPCLVRNDGGIPVLVDGYSRYRAIVQINRRKLAPSIITVECVYFQGSEKEAFLAGISANKARNSTTQADDGANIARLQRFGMSLGDIAAFYQEDESWCKKRLTFASLGERARKAVKSGAVLPNAVAALAKLSEEEQDKKVEGATHAKPVSRSSVAPVPASKPALRSVVKAIAEGGEPPFVVTEDTRLNEFCQKLLDYIS